MAQTCRAGTCLVALRSTFDFRPDDELLMEEEDELFRPHLAVGDSDLDSSDWVPFTLQALIRGCVPMHSSVDWFTSRQAGPVFTQ